MIPVAVLGHSLGEVAAAVAAGILNEMDALKLVVVRSQLIDALPKSSMLVVACDIDTLKIQIKQAFSKTDNYLDIAAVNSPNQTVVSGSSNKINEFKMFWMFQDVATTVALRPISLTPLMDFTLN